MSNPHPIALRERLVAAYEGGEGSYPEIAVRFDLGEATVKRWVWLKRETGGLTPAAKGGGTPSAISQAEVDELLQRLGDATALELTAEFNRPRRSKQRVHVSSMKRALHRFGYVVKKNADGRWRYCCPAFSVGALAFDASRASRRTSSSSSTHLG